MERLFSMIGLVVFLGIAYAFSSDRKAISFRTVAWGLGLQFALALFVLQTPVGQGLFAWIGALVTRVLDLAFVGSEFVFGKLGAKGGGGSRSASSSPSRSYPRSSSPRPRSRCS